MSLHDKIMNLPRPKAPTLPQVGGSPAVREDLAHSIGFNDARQAAAELALEADAEIERLRKDAERYRAIRLDHEGELLPDIALYAGRALDDYIDAAMAAKG